MTRAHRSHAAKLISTTGRLATLLMAGGEGSRALWISGQASHVRHSADIRIMPICPPFNRALIRWRMTEFHFASRSAAAEEAENFGTNVRANASLGDVIAEALCVAFPRPRRLRLMLAP